MIKKPVAIIVGLLLLLGGLFKCDAFSKETPMPEPPPTSAEETPLPELTFLPDEYTILCIAEKTVGFEWENGDWVSKSFQPMNKWLVGKGDVTLFQRWLGRIC